MSETIRAQLANAQQGHAALNAAYRQIKPHLLAGREFELTIKPATRSDAENRMLHALLGHLAKTHPWAGKKRDIDTWKRLIVAAWFRAKGDSVELLPALDGHGIDIVYCPTSKLTRKECADLIEFVMAWCALNDIALPADPRLP